MQVSPKATNQRYKDLSINSAARSITGDSIASSGGTRGHRGGRLKRVHAQLFGSSPVLEAFGNAQTERNDNSSRFGKYLELQFDWGGGVVGGKVTSYLLEKSRVISHSPNERSFHVFYQWCSGAFHSPQVSSPKRSLQGPEASDFELRALPVISPRDATHWRYLQREASVIPGVDDAVAGREVAAAMASVGMDVNQRSVVASLLGAVLALGEVHFADALSTDGVSSGGAQVTAESRRWLDEAAYLLGLAALEPSTGHDNDLASTTLSSPDASASGSGDVKSLPVKPNDKKMAHSGRLLERALTTHAVEFAAAGAPSPNSSHGSPSDNASSSWIVKQLSPEAAAANTDTLAKELYKRLFLWIIDRINDGTDVSTIAAEEKEEVNAATDSHHPSSKKKQKPCRNAVAEGKDYANLGVLDIYGFELLGSNGFEQLCINYANERLQQLAVALTLKAEQEEYVAEGISWAEVAYQDNLATVTLIEKSRGGLFALLDEAGTLRGNLPSSSGATSSAKKQGTSSVDPRDAGFATSVMRTFGISDDYDKSEASSRKIASTSSANGSPGLSSDVNTSGLVVGPAVRKRESFCVKHYAGFVEYRYDGFVEKNEDSLYSDLVNCLSQHSTCAAVRSMWAQTPPPQPITAAEVAAADESRRSPSSRRQSITTKQRPPSVSSQFKQQVSLLVATLSASKPHYVRCVKPNHHRLPRKADAQLLLHQVCTHHVTFKLSTPRSFFALMYTNCIIPYRCYIPQVQYLGLAETVAVRRAGFCQRLLQLHFLRRYGIISTHPDVWPPAKHRQAGDLCRFLLLGSSTDNSALSKRSRSGISDSCRDLSEDPSKIGVNQNLTTGAAIERFRHTRLSQVLAPFGPLALTEGIDFAIGKTKVSAPMHVEEYLYVPIRVHHANYFYFVHTFCCCV